MGLHWQERAEINGDVVTFRYLTDSKQAAGPRIERAYSEVYIWDIDKTYLDTSWATVGELLRTVIEKALQKKNVPGTASLVRALGAEWTERRGELTFPIYFITASPPQMEERLREKLELDGIRPLGVFYKDNLKNWKPARWWRLANQIGYKIQALLQLRTGQRADVRQILWGDDSESDAIIYSLYSDICSRRLTEDELIEVLARLRVTGEQAETILAIQDQLPVQDPVEKIYINLATDTDPEYYLKFGRRMVPTSSSFEVALDLFQDGRLRIERFLGVVSDLKDSYGFSRFDFERGLDHMVRRRILGRPAFEECSTRLKELGLVGPNFTSSLDPRDPAVVREGRVYSLEGSHDPWVPEQIDYLST